MTPTDIQRRIHNLSTRMAAAISLGILSLLLFRNPLLRLAALTFGDYRYSHAALVPVLAAVLLYVRKARIFRAPHYSLTAGIAMLAAGLLCCLLGPAAGPNPADQLFVPVLGIVISWIAIFVLCYGTSSFRNAAFPLLFLFLMAPVPTVAVDMAVLGLQKGSADMSEVLFRIAGVPMLRNGLTFSLPGVDIDIAEQCSGIRSSVSLVLTSMIAGEFLLQSTWKRICLWVMAVPIVIFKNAVRIVTISWLGVYVDPGFFSGQLHRNSGVPFSLLAIALLGGAVYLLKVRMPEPGSHPRLAE